MKLTIITNLAFFCATERVACDEDGNYGVLVLSVEVFLRTGMRIQEFAVWTIE